MSLSTTVVASIAAFFSVYGLAHTFAGAFWSVVAMGSALEAGKLMLASFVYRFRSHIGWTIKLPAYAFIVALMIVTSIGIYGYLSAAYQTDTLGSKEIVSTLHLKQEQQVTLQARKTQIDQQISQLPTSDVRGRQRLNRQFESESVNINKQLSSLSTDIQQLSQEQIKAEAHVGPIIYIAQVLGIGADKAISLLMLLIIFAFDPLAMLLTIATNIAISEHQNSKYKLPELSIVEHIEPIIVPTEAEVPMVIGPEIVLPIRDDSLIVGIAQAAEEVFEPPIVEVQVPIIESTSAIDKIKEIAHEIETAPDNSPETAEMKDMINKFLTQQELIRSTRRD